MRVLFGFLGARFSEFSPQGNPSVCHGRQLPLHRGAMGSRCPPGVDRLVFGLIGRRCFGGRGSEALPFLRTEMFFQNIPVFRSAYFPQRVHSTLCSKTLDLQPLRGLRWAGGASLPPAPPSPAPGMRGKGAVDKRGKSAAGRTAKKRNARVFPAFLLLYSVVRSADRTGFPDARRSGGAGGRRRQRARRSRRRRG